MLTIEMRRRRVWQESMADTSLKRKRRSFAGASGLCKSPPWIIARHQPTCPFSRGQARHNVEPVRHEFTWSVSRGLAPMDSTGVQSSSAQLEQWIRQAQAGSADAFGRLATTVAPYLLWLANRELDPDVQAKGGASDLVQETFLHAQR